MSFIERKNSGDIPPLGKQEIRWHFWFIVVFSAFLVVTFVYYLPTRFLYSQTQEHHEEMGHDEMMGGMVPHDDTSADVSDPNVAHEHTDETMIEGIDEHMSEEMMEHMDEQMSEEHVMEGSGAAHGHDSSLYHEENSVAEGVVVNLNVSPVSGAVGAPTKLDFFVNEKPGSVPVTDLQIDHEKLIHVIGVRDDLNEFFHIHPGQVAGSPGLFSVTRTFEKPGTYKVWSDIKRDGVIHSFGHPPFTIEGAGAKSEPEVDLGTNKIVGNYQVKLNRGEKIVSGRETDIVFEIRDVVGTPVTVEPYLGAPMHLAVIKSDWKVYLHTHPEGGHAHSKANPLVKQAFANGGDHSGDPAEQISFHVNFPEEGMYKLFGQFRPSGIELPPDESFVAEFYVQVEAPRGILAYSNWWSNLIISLLLMFFLSWGVKKYITV